MVVVSGGFSLEKARAAAVTAGKTEGVEVDVTGVGSSQGRRIT